MKDIKVTRLWNQRTQTGMNGLLVFEVFPKSGYRWFIRFSLADCDHASYVNNVKGR